MSVSQCWPGHPGVRDAVKESRVIIARQQLHHRINLVARTDSHESEKCVYKDFLYLFDSCCINSMHEQWYQQTALPVSEKSVGKTVQSTPPPPDVSCHGILRCMVCPATSAPTPSVVIPTVRLFTPMKLTRQVRNSQMTCHSLPLIVHITYLVGEFSFYSRIFCWVPQWSSNVGSLGATRSSLL